MRFLLFQIYAPMVSWGEIAVGGERHSARHPSKSAIIGLMSAALGIKRDEEKRLNVFSQSVGMAVQLYSGGTILKDFHTVKSPRSIGKSVYRTRREEVLALDDKDNAIISKRDYRCDAYSVVGVYLKNDCYDVTLDEIKKALCKPTFHLYFGRKSSVPALPLAPVIVDSDNVREAFDQFTCKFVSPIDENSPAWMCKAFESYPSKTIFGENISYFWEDGVPSGFENTLKSVERYDQPSSRKRWQFSSRCENMVMLKREEGINVSQ